jgi:hypothetical protein
MFIKRLCLLTDRPAGRIDAIVTHKTVDEKNKAEYKGKVYNGVLLVKLSEKAVPSTTAVISPMATGGPCEAPGGGSGEEWSQRRNASTKVYAPLSHWLGCCRTRERDPYQDLTFSH